MIKQTNQYDLILSAIAELRQRLERIEEKIDRETDKRESFWTKHYTEHNKIWTDISALKIKAGFWGIAGGALVLFVMLMIEFFKNYIFK